MTWVLLDDSFGDHPKVVAAGPHAAILQVRALCYANRHLTDGRIPAAILPSLILDLEPRDWPAHMTEFALWEVVPGGWKIHDFLVYNASKRRVLALRKAKKDAGRKGAMSRWNKARIAPAIPVASTSQCPTPTPTPTPTVERTAESQDLPSPRGAGHTGSAPTINLPAEAKTVRVRRPQPAPKSRPESPAVGQGEASAPAPEGNHNPKPDRQPRRPHAVQDPDIREAVKTYEAGYEQKFGEKPVILWAQACGQLAPVVRTRKLDAAKALLAQFFASSDRFVSQSDYSLGAFLGNVHRLLAELRNGGQPASGAARGDKNAQVLAAMEGAGRRLREMEEAKKRP